MQQDEIRGHSIFLISITIERLTAKKLWKVLKEARNWGKANPNKVTSKTWETRTRDIPKTGPFIGSSEVEFSVYWGGAV